MRFTTRTSTVSTRKSSSAHFHCGVCMLFVVVSGGRGSPECPRGYYRITDYETCAAASAALLNPQPHSKNGFYHQDHQNWNDPNYPTGCMYYHNHQASRLNNAKSGKANMNAYLICVGELCRKEARCSCYIFCILCVLLVIVFALLALLFGTGARCGFSCTCAFRYL